MVGSKATRNAAVPHCKRSKRILSRAHLLASCPLCQMQLMHWGMCLWVLLHLVRGSFPSFFLACSCIGAVSVNNSRLGRQPLPLQPSTLHLLVFLSLPPNFTDFTPTTLTLVDQIDSFFTSSLDHLIPFPNLIFGSPVSSTWCLAMSAPETTGSPPPRVIPIPTCVLHEDNPKTAEDSPLSSASTGVSNPHIPFWLSLDETSSFATLMPSTAFPCPSKPHKEKRSP